MPTIFNYPAHLQKKKVTRKSPKKRFFVEPEITFEPSPTKIAKVSVVDHAYSKKSQPEAEVSQLRKHVKILKQKVRQRNKRMKCMKDLMKSLKEKQLIAATEHEVLSHNFNSVSKHLFDDQMKNSKTESNLSNQYTMETKQFAMTLHYYSPKAYEFVCKILCLPHSSTIRAWSSSVDCEPGFLGNVIKSIGNLVQTKKWMSDVVLIVDAMALHKGTTWDLKSKSYVSLVDYGTAKPEVEENLATEALVFMVAGVTGHWKHPVAYFLQDKCSANVQAQLI